MKQLPQPSALMTLHQLADLSGASAARVAELVELGWVTPRSVGGEALFPAQEVYRVRKLERICSGLRIESLAGTVIVDLLHRVEELEREVEAMRRLI
jgi:chaperone modulatory protein CbpM